MIPPKDIERLEEWSQYFVYGETEDGDYCVKGLKKNTPKKIIKDFREWYKVNYPEITEENAEQVPNI